MITTRRGAALVATGIALWALGVLLGSRTAHVVAVALVALPVIGWLDARRRVPRLVVTRRLSDARVAPGRRVEVEIEVENRSSRALPYVLVEDEAPAARGGAARLVLPGLDGRAKRRVSYAVTPTARGRHPLGPMRVEVADPFGLAQRRVVMDLRDEIVVTPPVEDLLGPDPTRGERTGLFSFGRLAPSTGEFSLMRPYVEGDDLRRIHWPSVARRGELMIRQDETSSRSRAVLLLDARASTAGVAGGPVFEHLVGAAASLGVMLLRSGAAVRFATGVLAPRPTTEDALLDTLAGVGPDGAGFGIALARLRGLAAADTALVVAAPAPDAADTTSLIRTGSTFGPKLAVLVPRPGESGDGSLHALGRAGWRVLVVPPGTTLRERWNAIAERRSSASAR